jgi:hypothetical protein
VTPEQKVKKIWKTRAIVATVLQIVVRDNMDFDILQKFKTLAEERCGERIPDDHPEVEELVKLYWECENSPEEKKSSSNNGEPGL